MSADADGLREAIEALRLDLNADAEYLVTKGSIGHRLHRILAAHPASESAPTAGERTRICYCPNRGDNYHLSGEPGCINAPAATPPADAANTDASEGLSEAERSLLDGCVRLQFSTDRDDMFAAVERIKARARAEGAAEVAFDALMTDDVRRLMAQEYLIDRNDYHGQDLTRHAQAMAAALRAAFASIARGDAAPDAG